MDGCAGGVVVGGQCRGDGEGEGAGGAEGVDVPVEREGEVNDPAFWGGFGGAPCSLGFCLSGEGPAFVRGREGVAGCAVGGGAHVAYGWDDEFKGLGGGVGGSALDVGDKVFSLEDGLAGRRVVCEGDHVWA